MSSIPAALCYFEVRARFSGYDTVSEVVTKVQRYLYGSTFKRVEVDHRWDEGYDNQYLVLLVQGTSFQSLHDLQGRTQAQIDRLLSGGIGSSEPTYYTPNGS